MEEAVKFEISKTSNGKQIGIACLNREKALNSLQLETIDSLLAQFRIWMSDPAVVCLVLRSATDRAFCAGADITRLYHSIKAAEQDASHANAHTNAHTNAYTNAHTNTYGDAFFSHEYELDLMIHQCQKPILAWGHQVVMGGGLGLLAGCSHRVGTPESRLAMPEITIGLFPDAGASWFLSRLRGHLGHFIGLTGCIMTVADALDLGLVNHVLKHEDQAEVLAGMADLPWSGGGESGSAESGSAGSGGAESGSAENDHALLSQHLEKFSLPDLPDLPDLPEPALLQHEAAISQLMADSLAADDFFAVFESGLEAALKEANEDEWLASAAQTYFAGSAVTARVFVEQMRRAGGMSLAEAFSMELVIARQCLRHPDFPEGVRALLIDKDRNPAWSHASTSDVPEALVQQHFKPL